MKRVAKPGEIGNQGNIEVRNGRELYLIPPFVNGHSHSYTGILKRTVNKVPLDLYMLDAIALGENRESDLIYDCTYLRGLELLRNGFQVTDDHFSQRPYLNEEGIQAAIQAYKDLGLKAVIAPMFSDLVYMDSLPFVTNKKGASSPISPYAQLIEQLMKKYKSDSIIEIALGVDGVQRCTDDLLLSDKTFAARV
ncbi:hypothetical protein MUN88_03685 [Gracilibacillus caseinilyticus]|uniref:Amidohydrolase-related domain-containing protein n=1 Tax=Gracilibacillus caseinilyticus TaxID=2932256 RepID=A0ABY4EXV1_9BACI|nr:hypothetical protein [Gracilibacillus caseinilyticus]UOQ49238.1 hypothetical protein MUN88_03685 [Gracilibacillus caseinilyticus]